MCCFSLVLATPGGARSIVRPLCPPSAMQSHDCHRSPCCLWTGCPIPPRNWRWSVAPDVGLHQLKGKVRVCPASSAVSPLKATAGEEQLLLGEEESPQRGRGGACHWGAVMQEEEAAGFVPAVGIWEISGWLLLNTHTHMHRVALWPLTFVSSFSFLASLPPFASFFFCIWFWSGGLMNKAAMENSHCKPPNINTVLSRDVITYFAYLVVAPLVSINTVQLG